MGDGGWKRDALGGNKEKFVQIKGFLYVKKAAFEDSSQSFLLTKTFWFAEKANFFSSCKATEKEKRFSAHHSNHFALHQS